MPPWLNRERRQIVMFVLGVGLVVLAVVSSSAEDWPDWVGALALASLTGGILSKGAP